MRNLGNKQVEENDTVDPPTDEDEEPRTEPNRPETKIPGRGAAHPATESGCTSAELLGATGNGTAADWGAFGKRLLAIGGVATSVPRIPHRRASIIPNPSRAGRASGFRVPACPPRQRHHHSIVCLGVDSRQRDRRVVAPADAATQQTNDKVAALQVVVASGDSVVYIGSVAPG